MSRERTVAPGDEMSVWADDARADLRVGSDGLPLDEFWIADDDGPRRLSAGA